MQNESHKLLEELFNSINQFYDFYKVRYMDEDESNSEVGKRYSVIYHKVKDYLDETNRQTNQGH